MVRPLRETAVPSSSKQSDPPAGKDETSDVDVERAFRARWRLAASKSLIGRSRLRGPPDSDTCTLRGDMDGEEMGCVGTPGRWPLGDGSDFQQAIDLAVLPSSSFSWPVGAHCSPPTHSRHPKAPNAAAVRNSAGPATRDGSSGLSRPRPVLEGGLSTALALSARLLAQSFAPDVSLDSQFPTVNTDHQPAHRAGGRHNLSSGTPRQEGPRRSAAS